MPRRREKELSIAAATAAPAVGGFGRAGQATAAAPAAGKVKRRSGPRPALWALVGLTLGAGAAFATPVRMVERLVYELYLDRFSDVFQVPIGPTARAVWIGTIALGSAIAALLACAFLYGGKPKAAAPVRKRGGAKGRPIVSADSDAPLGDAPVLRAADAHPDAPARAPLRATDLPIAGLAPAGEEAAAVVAAPDSVADMGAQDEPLELTELALDPTLMVADDQMATGDAAQPYGHAPMADDAFDATPNYAQSSAPFAAPSQSAPFAAPSESAPFAAPTERSPVDALRALVDGDAEQPAPFGGFDASYDAPAPQGQAYDAPLNAYDPVPTPAAALADADIHSLVARLEARLARPAQPDAPAQHGDAATHVSSENAPAPVAPAPVASLSRPPFPVAGDTRPANDDRTLSDDYRAQAAAHPDDQALNAALATLSRVRAARQG